MNSFYRVFGLSAVEPLVGPLIEHLEEKHPGLLAHVKGDQLGWMRLELHVAAAAPPLILERFLVEEADLRHKLNGWVAWLETVPHPLRENVIDQVVNTQQLFTLELPAELAADQQVQELARATCLYLAHATDGVFQVDEQGFFNADGLLLVPEFAIV